MMRKRNFLLKRNNIKSQLLKILVDIKCFRSVKSVDEPSAVTMDQDLSMFITKIPRFQFCLHNKLNTPQIEDRMSLAISQYVIKR